MKGIIKFKKSDDLLYIDIEYTPLKIEKGLMFRKRLNENKGILFILPEYKKIYIWMKNTYIPLDVLFIKDDTVVDIISNTEPLCKKKLSTLKNHNIILEVNSNYCKNHNIKIGDKFEIKV